MIKTLRIITLLVILIFPCLYIYGENNNHHINTNKYLNESNFYQIPVDFFEDEYFPDGLEKVFSDNKITSLNDLINCSNHVLLVETSDDLIYSGNGVLRELKIKKVIKSSTLKDGDFVKVYEPIQSWNMKTTNYLGLSTPLKNNSMYYIFINEAPEPNIKDTFIFSTLTFGHFSTDNQFSYLKTDVMITAQEDKYISIKEASNYEYIGVDEEKRELYEKIKKEIGNANWSLK